MPLSPQLHDGALVDSPPDKNLVLQGGHDEELPKLLLTLKRATKAADDDVLFLQRRVQKLRAEEDHVWKKLELARQQKQLVETIRERRREDADFRSSSRHRQQDAEARERARLHDERDAQRHALFLARSKLAMERRERSAVVRREASQLNSAREEQQRRACHKALEQHERIAEMKRRSVAAKERRTTQQSRMTHDQHEAEILKLQCRQHQDVQVAAQLLTEEAQIIHRLQRIKEETTSVLSNITPHAVASTPSPRRPAPPQTPRADGVRERKENATPSRGTKVIRDDATTLPAVKA